MGNTGSGKRDRAYSSDVECPSSPSKDEKVFEFGTGGQKNKFLYQPSLEECDDFSTPYKDKMDDIRPRTTTISAAATIHEKCLPTVFKWEGGGKDVHISGTFSEWKPIQMVNSHGDFALILEIPEGEHQYKFQVDGQWVHDPNQPTVDNDLGTKNNVISVQKSDFEVFEALAVDSISTTSGSSTVSGSPPGSYSQEIPQRKPYEKSAGPPILPPHLMQQVILNKDVPESCEPTLLPEPNHVMLNHLYALSIKDGVMVLSATHRYRKKYVTTVLYKPI